MLRGPTNADRPAVTNRGVDAVALHHFDGLDGQPVGADGAGAGDMTLVNGGVLQVDPFRRRGAGRRR